MSSAKQRSFPFLPTLLSIGAIGVLTPLAVRIYRHPWETMLDIVRAGLLLIGVREETIDVGGLSMRYYRAGRRGKPIVLVHGLGSSAESWATLIPLLSKEYLVYAPDMPGFGKTPLAPEGTNIRTHVLYLEHFLNALGNPQVTLVGNSLGGWIAARFAAEHPERVERLYLLNSAGLSHELINSPYAIDRATARLSMEHIWGRSWPLPGFLLDAIVRISLTPAFAGFIQGYDSQEELDTLLGQMLVPTTIIWGELDRLLPITFAHDFHAGIADSELILLPGVAHAPQLQAPFTVARIIMERRAFQPIALDSFTRGNT